MGEIVRIGDIQPNTAITLTTGDGGIAMSVDDVLRWVAPAAPKSEALKFLLTCKAAQVNPFLKEAHLVEMGGKFETIIDKSGWLKRANTNEDYDGFQAGIIVRPVDITTRPPTPLGPPENHVGAVQPSGYELLGGWAKVYRKSRRFPVEERVQLSDYRNPRSPNWQQRPTMMIRKVALVQALRESGFLVSGTYDKDEMPDLDVEALEARVIPRPEAASAAVVEAIDVEYRHTPTHQLPPDMAAELEASIQRAGMSDWQRDTMLARRGVSSIVELNEHDAREIIGKLYHVIDQADAGRIMLPDSPETTDGEVIDVEFVVS